VAFSHSGATLGLIAGELLAGEIANGKEHALLTRFRPDRFSLIQGTAESTARGWDGSPKKPPVIREFESVHIRTFVHSMASYFSLIGGSTV
jgi:hypothetical protein